MRLRGKISIIIFCSLIGFAAASAVSAAPFASEGEAATYYCTLTHGPCNGDGEATHMFLETLVGQEPLPNYGCDPAQSYLGCVLPWSTSSAVCCSSKKKATCADLGTKYKAAEATCYSACTGEYREVAESQAPGVCADATLRCCVRGTKAAAGAGAAAVAREGFKLPSTGNFQSILGRVIKIILGISGSLALASIMYGGFLWLTSGGSVETITKARNIIVWAALGLVVIFASYAIVSTVFDIVSQATGTQILQVSP